MRKKRHRDTNPHQLTLCMANTIILLKTNVGFWKEQEKRGQMVSLRSCSVWGPRMLGKTVSTLGVLPTGELAFSAVPSSFGPSPIPVQTSSALARGALKHCPALCLRKCGGDKRSVKAAGRWEKTAGITSTPILTYKSCVSAARQVLEGWRFCPLSPTDSYLQVAAGPVQAGAQVISGWSRKRRQMEEAGASLLEVSKGADCIFGF